MENMFKLQHKKMWQSGSKWSVQDRKKEETQEKAGRWCWQGTWKCSWIHGE